MPPGQPAVDFVQHGMPVDQQIENHERRHQQQGEKIDDREALAPDRCRSPACKACPVFRQSASVAHPICASRPRPEPCPRPGVRPPRNRVTSPGSAAARSCACERITGTISTRLATATHHERSDNQQRSDDTVQPQLDQLVCQGTQRNRRWRCRATNGSRISLGTAIVRIGGAAAVIQNRTCRSARIVSPRS